MKNFVIAILLLPAIFASADGLPEAVNLWSGRAVELAGGTQWSLNAAHGRTIANGSGPVRLDLPPLAPGATVAATLHTDGMEDRAVMIHSPEPLPPLRFAIAGFAEDAAARLVRYGMTPELENTVKIHVAELWPETMPDGLTLLFPAKFEFPLELDQSWHEITLRRSASAGGTLGIAVKDGVLQLTNDGNFTFALLRKKTVTLAVFPPDFAWDDIDAVLLVKSVIDSEIK
ncbi:MAG: hypothetical protein PHI85_11195 [Victivallaceae bacterium]|nr:hypothetical protein [Victivallaceae bacterium]